MIMDKTSPRRKEDTTKKQKRANVHWNETHLRTRMMNFLMQSWNFIRPLNIHVIIKEIWQNTFWSRVKVWERHYYFWKNKTKWKNFYFQEQLWNQFHIWEKKFKNWRNVCKWLNISKLISTNEEVVNIPIRIRKSLNASPPLELSSRIFIEKHHMNDN